MNQSNRFLYRFPPDIDLETKSVLKAVARAHRYLAELKGVAQSMPNEAILINTLSLQEAKDSSEVENIVTTHDDLFKAELFEASANPSAKEAERYAQALREGFFAVKESGLLTNNQIIKIQQILERNRAGFRKLPGTDLKNRETGELIYTPPQDHQQVVELMSTLEKFINEKKHEYDPLIKMALIHFQFESIHPFYDGNGRTGRIVNILYLVLQGLLDIPVLYLSRYIIQRKEEYYRLLQGVRDHDLWEDWILFMLEGVATTSHQTIRVIQDIRELMIYTKHRIRNELPKIYSQDLINNLFRHPYTKIQYLKEDLGVSSRHTATRYLDQLADAGILDKKKHGRSNYYINTELIKILFNIPNLPLN